MLADGAVNKITTDSTKKEKYIRRSARVICTANDVAPTVKVDGRTVNQSKVFKDENITIPGIAFYKGNSPQEVVSDFIEGEAYFAVWFHPVASKSTITIRPDSFPGTYYVTGDTMVRSERSGEDEYFQFIIPKAKMQAEQTISMEAEGDPSTFNMSLQILRPEDGEMIQFVQYSFADKTDKVDTNDTTLAGGDDGWLSNSETDILAGEKIVTVLFYKKDGTLIEGIITKASDDPKNYDNWNSENTKDTYKDYVNKEGEIFSDIGLTKSGAYYSTSSL
jgi:hypothetical protein